MHFYANFALNTGYHENELLTIKILTNYIRIIINLII